MGKLIGIILLTSILSIAVAENTQQQMDAGKWVDDAWNENVKKEAISKTQSDKIERCIRKIKKYEKKLEKKSDSLYYKFKLSNWKSRCK